MMQCKCGCDHPDHFDERTAPAPASPILEHAHEAARRLLATEAEVLAMPKEQANWFMGKPGHSDAFDLARFVLSLKSPDAKPEQPPVIGSLSPARLRAMADFCRSHLRSDYAYELREAADWMERRQ